MDDDDRRRRMQDLEARLAEKRAAQAAETPHQQDHHSQAQLAWRMVTEMVAGLGIGFGIGYGLDAYLGTGPWMMLAFTLLGIAAGINVMLRTARETQVAPLEAAKKASGAEDGSPGAKERTKDGD